MKSYRRLSFKKQLTLFMISIGAVAEILIAVFIYRFETDRVEKSTTLLINNTTKQTATMFGNRLELVLNQFNKLGDTTALWRLASNRYDTYGPTQIYDDRVEVYNNMNGLYAANSEIVDSIYFENKDGVSVQVYNDMVYEKVSADMDEFLQQQYDENYGYIWINDHVDTIFRTNIPRNVISVAQILKDTSGQQTGILILNLKTGYFKELLNQVEISENAYTALVSSDGYLISDAVNADSDLSDVEIRDIYQHVGSDTYKFREGASKEIMLTFFSPISVNRWYLAAIVPYKDMISSSRQLAQLLTTIIVILVLVTIAIGLVFASLITRPIEKLTRQVIAFQKDPDVDFHVNSGYEIMTLANGLSQMKISVNQLLDQVRQEQDQKAKLKLQILQAQIQPHFLYNTLASINQLIAMHENEKAGQMCEALSGFYRLGLSNGKDIITVREEIEHIRNYLMIQRFRYEKDFDYSINVADNIMEKGILKLSLQPLVENAIYHGIKNKEEKGTIVISGYQKDNEMILEVFDDGKGMTAEQLQELNEKLQNGTEQGDSYGLFNVNSRLQLFFGKQAHLEYDSGEGVYTQVKVVIPL